MDDFEGIKNQIHSKIREQIEEIPASEEEEENGNGLPADEVVNESPLNHRLKKRRQAAD